MPLEHVTDHEPRGLARLTSRFRKPDTQAVLSAPVYEVQETEDALWSVAGLSLDGATGAQLDQVGALLGEARATLDDEPFRAALRTRAAKKHAASKHAAAVAIANDVYRQAQAARSQLRAVLDQAAHAELGFAEAVATADAAASDEVALHATLGALIELAEKTLQQGGPVAAVLKADGFGAASIERYTALRTKLATSHETTRGAAGNGPVTQAELDAQDGVLLVYMRGLRETFRAFRRTDPRAPALIVRATGSYFGRRTRASKEPAPAPADGGTVTPAKK